VDLVPGGDDVITSEICRAIAGRRLVELDYNGRRRLIEPYSHGFSSDGREMLVGYQRAGGSDSGQIEGWKALAVERIERLALVDVSFIPSRVDYRAGSSKNIDELHCEI
jgi:hypothetical protein